MILTQSMADIDEIYGKSTRSAMFNNFAYKVVLGATDVETQKYYSDLIGMEDREKVSVTNNGAFLSPNYSETKSTERRYIIEPAELANLGTDLIVLYPGGYKRLKKNFYFKNSPRK